MAIGFVLIKVDPGMERGVLTSLMEIEAVAEAFPLFGEYDLIVKAEAPDYDELGRIVVQGIRALPGVRKTETLTVTRF